MNQFNIIRVRVAPEPRGTRNHARLEEIMTKGTMTKEATICMTEVDLARLRNLIEVARDTGGDANRPYLNRLEAELDRAEVVEPKEIPNDTITMRSTVRLRDMDSGKKLLYSLVFPNEADTDKGRISVLAPIGTALLGYRVGDVIEWEVPS